MAKIDNQDFIDIAEKLSKLDTVDLVAALAMQIGYISVDFADNREIPQFVEICLDGWNESIKQIEEAKANE